MPTRPLTRANVESRLQWEHEKTKAAESHRQLQFASSLTSKESKRKLPQQPRSHVELPPRCRYCMSVALVRISNKGKTRTSNLACLIYTWKGVAPTRTVSRACLGSCHRLNSTSLEKDSTNEVVSPPRSQLMWSDSPADNLDAAGRWCAREQHREWETHLKRGTFYYQSAAAADTFGSNDVPVRKFLLTSIGGPSIVGKRLKSVQMFGHSRVPSARMCLSSGDSRWVTSGFSVTRVARLIDRRETLKSAVRKIVPVSRGSRLIHFPH